jgi:hypothetical protein
MIFKKQVADTFWKWAPLTDVAWDDESVKEIADSDRLSVRVIHISKTVSLGQMRVGGDRTHGSEWSIRGVMTRPKFIPVDITFTNDDELFGGFSYDRQDDRDFNGRKVNLPFLSMWLSDRNGQKAQLLYSALRDAIMCGQKCADARF